MVQPFSVFTRFMVCDRRSRAPFARVANFGRTGAVRLHFFRHNIRIPGYNSAGGPSCPEGPQPARWSLKSWTQIHKMHKIYSKWASYSDFTLKNARKFEAARQTVPQKLSLAVKNTPKHFPLPGEKEPMMFSRRVRRKADPRTNVTLGCDNMSRPCHKAEGTHHKNSQLFPGRASRTCYAWLCRGWDLELSEIAEFAGLVCSENEITTTKQIKLYVLWWLILNRFRYLWVGEKS